MRKAGLADAALVTGAQAALDDSYRTEAVGSLGVV